MVFNKLAGTFLTMMLLSITGLPVGALDAADDGSKMYVAQVPVLYAAGELTPENGLVVVWANDVGLARVGGLFCQSPPGGDICLPDDRTARSFCGGVSLYDGRNWDSGMDTYIYVGSPMDRLAPGVRCVQPAPATTGLITWWPGPAA